MPQCERSLKKKRSEKGKQVQPPQLWIGKLQYITSRFLDLDLDTLIVLIVLIVLCSPVCWGAEGERQELVPEGLILRNGLCPRQFLQIVVLREFANRAAVGTHVARGSIVWSFLKSKTHKGTSHIMDSETNSLCIVIWTTTWWSHPKVTVAKIKTVSLNFLTTNTCVLTRKAPCLGGHYSTGGICRQDTCTGSIAEKPKFKHSKHITIQKFWNCSQSGKVWHCHVIVMKTSR